MRTIFVFDHAALPRLGFDRKWTDVRPQWPAAPYDGLLPLIIPSSSCILYLLHVSATIFATSSRANRCAQTHCCDVWTTYVKSIGRLTKQRSFIPDSLLLNKTLISGAIRNIGCNVVYCFVWPHLASRSAVVWLRPWPWPKCRGRGRGQFFASWPRLTPHWYPSPLAASPCVQCKHAHLYRSASTPGWLTP